jgi:YbgC/YbaW family acyl-CoA thioester hydrolase
MALQENNFTLDKMKKNGYLVVIRRIEIEYKLPLYMNENVLIKTSLSHARKTSGTFHQQILDEEKKQISAEAWVTWVFTNLEGKPIPIPDEIRQAFDIK